MLPLFLLQMAPNTIQASQEAHSRGKGQALQHSVGENGQGCYFQTCQQEAQALPQGDILHHV